MKKLYINIASYFTEDSYGNKILLRVNYWENKFTMQIKDLKDDNIGLLQNEVKKLALDMLKRKSRVNFAK